MATVYSVGHGLSSESWQYGAVVMGHPKDPNLRGVAAATHQADIPPWEFDIVAVEPGTDPVRVSDWARRGNPLTWKRRAAETREYRPLPLNVVKSACMSASRRLNMALTPNAANASVGSSDWWDSHSEEDEQELINVRKNAEEFAKYAQMAADASDSDRVADFAKMAQEDATECQSAPRRRSGDLCRQAEEAACGAWLTVGVELAPTEVLQGMMLSEDFTPRAKVMADLASNRLDYRKREALERQSADSASHTSGGYEAVNQRGRRDGRSDIWNVVGKEGTIPYEIVGEGRAKLVAELCDRSPLYAKAIKKGHDPREAMECFEVSECRDLWRKWDAAAPVRKQHERERPPNRQTRWRDGQGVGR